MCEYFKKIGSSFLCFQTFLLWFLIKKQIMILNTEFTYCTFYSNLFTFIQLKSITFLQQNLCKWMNTFVFRVCRISKILKEEKSFVFVFKKVFKFHKVVQISFEVNYSIWMHLTALHLLVVINDEYVIKKCQIWVSKCCHVRKHMCLRQFSWSKLLCLCRYFCYDCDLPIFIMYVVGTLANIVIK